MKKNNLSSASASEDITLQEDLRSCAYTAFSSKGVSDADMPAFLQASSAHEFSAEKFKEFISSDIQTVFAALKSVENPMEQVCIWYGLLNFISTSSDDYQRLKLSVISSYVSLIVSARMSTTLGNIELEKSMFALVELMLPMLLPDILKFSTGGMGKIVLKGDISCKDLTDKGLLDGIMPAPKLLEIFLHEYESLEITTTEAYLLWLCEVMHFLYILFRQDCTDLNLSSVEKLVRFIQAKRPVVDHEELLAVANLELLYPCIAMLETINSRVLPANTNIYYEAKSLLFSLVLNVLYHEPFHAELADKRLLVFRSNVNALCKCAFAAGKLSETQYLDIYNMLFFCGSEDLEKYSEHIKSFSLQSLIALAQRVQSDALPCLSAAHYLNLILKSSILADKKYALGEGKKFFISTFMVFKEVFMRAMGAIAKLLYTDTDNCYSAAMTINAGGGGVQDSSVEQVLRFHGMDILVGLYKRYIVLYPEAKDLLYDLQVVNLFFMDRAKAWSNPEACELLLGVFKELESCGASPREMRFVVIKRGLSLLLERSAITNKILFTEEDLDFWESYLILFPRNDLSVYSADEKRVIDESFVAVLERVSFYDGEPYVFFAAKICIILINLVSKSARLVFFQQADKVIRILSTSFLAPEDSSYQISFLQQWLADFVKESDECFNSDALAQLKIIKHESASFMAKSLYICQMSEILYLIMWRASCFYDEEELYAKIEEISAFIISQRLSLGASLKDVDPGLLEEDKMGQILYLGHKFLDQEFIDLLRVKLRCEETGKVKKTIAKRNHKFLAITKISFMGDDLVIHCGESRFALKMSALIILKAEVRSYSNGSFSLFSGNDDDHLISIKPLAAEASSLGAAAEQLPDEELFALFDESKPSKNKGGKKTNKKPTEKTKAAASQTANITKNLDKKKSKTKKAVVVAPQKADVVSKDDFASVFASLKSAKTSSYLFKCFESMIKIVRAKLGFQVEFEIYEHGAIFSLGSATALLDASKEAQELWQDFVDLPVALLKNAGIANFVILTKDHKGHIAEIVPKEDMLGAFPSPRVSVLDSGLLEAITQWKAAVLQQIESRLKVKASFDNAKVSLTMGNQNAGAAAIAEPALVETIDVQTIALADLWPELLEAHARLLAQKYGGSMLFVKLVFDDTDHVIALDRSDYLLAANTSLARVSLREQDMSRSLADFFAPIDMRVVKIFSLLTTSQAELILKLMSYVTVDLYIYGHLVLELCHGDSLRRAGVERQPLQQLMIRIDKYSGADIRELCDILTVTEIGAVIKGIKQEAIYFDYAGISAAICLEHDHMMQSIFPGDHYSCKLSCPNFECMLPLDIPAEVGPAVTTGATATRDIFSENRYALKTALYWSKIMGRLGGSLREILISLGFSDVIAAPRFREKIWLDGVLGSVELLPGAASVLCAEFHLESEADAKLVLQEVNSML